MKNSDLVFQEVRRKQAIHLLLVNARDLAEELRGVAQDNQAQIGPALRRSTTCSRCSSARRRS